MNGEAKITGVHRDRLAVIYVRQSTLAQVREHTESTMRQYALAEEATRLGWAADAVEVIDADLGVSGRSVEGRDGFKALVARVCLGEIGAVFGLEISRLARSSADLSRMLELARLTDTLVIDADGIYDLADFNDRLLLGLKGTMSEAELHLLAGRLQGAKRAAAERGELRTPLPVGYVYDEDNEVVIDPDEEVAAAVADVFTAFTATGSAYGVVAAFTSRRFPRRAYGGAWAGQVRFDRLTHSRACSILSNPVYAGAYVFGRFRSRRTVRPDGSVRTVTLELPRTEWAVCIHDHHEGYIDWDTFLANESRLAANRTNAGARPPREGAALCQGIVFCGCCGRSMSTRYAARTRLRVRPSRADHVATPGCRSVRAATVDDAVATRCWPRWPPTNSPWPWPPRTRSPPAASGRSGPRSWPSNVPATKPNAQSGRSWPANRRTGWSPAAWRPAGRPAWSTSPTQTRPRTAGRQAQTPLPPPAELAAAVADMQTLWNAPSTSDKDRKRLLRTLLGDVTLRPGDTPRQLRVGIRWRTGATDDLRNVARSPPEPPCAARPRRSNGDPARPDHRHRRARRTAQRRRADHRARPPVRHQSRAVDPPRLPHPGPEPLCRRRDQRYRRRCTARRQHRRGLRLDQDRQTRRSTRPRNRLCIAWTDRVETECRTRIAESGHLDPAARRTIPRHRP